MLVVNDLPDAVYTRRGYVLGKSTLALVLNQNDVLKAGMKRDGLTQPMKRASTGFYASDFDSQNSGHTVKVYHTGFNHIIDSNTCSKRGISCSA